MNESKMNFIQRFLFNFMIIAAISGIIYVLYLIFLA